MARPFAKFTLASVTPSSLDSFRWIRFEHAAQTPRDVGILGRVRRCLLEIDLVEGELLGPLAGDVLEMDRLVIEMTLGEAVHVVAPAAGVNASVLDMGNRFRILVNEVEAMLPPQDLPKLPTARVLWDPKPDLKTAAAAWILAGGAHHTGFSHSVTVEHLVDFAEMAEMEVVVIDENTTIQDFKKELRWNELYYHLAKGI